jgi:hypothetical protein
MNTENFNIYDDVEVAPSAVLRRLRKNRYGLIQDLPEEELADPYELERQVVKSEFGPVLLLERKSKSSGFRHCVHSEDEIGFDAFGTVDFERYKPEFNKTRYHIDKLKEQLKDLVIMIEMINGRIKAVTKYKVLKYVKMGVIEVDDIADWDMWQFAMLYMRALRIKKQIVKSQELSRKRRQERCEKWLEPLG